MNCKKLIITIVAVLIVAGAVCWVTGVFAPKADLYESDLPKLTLKAGDLYEMGGYVWQVLESKDDKAFLITRDIIDVRAFDGAGRTNTWGSCPLRSWLNNEFYSGFSALEKSRITETNVVNNDNPWYGTDGGPDTVDKIFLLSIEEVVRYFGDSGALANWNGKDDSIRDEYGDYRQAELNMTDEQQKNAANRMIASIFSMNSNGVRETYEEAMEHFERRNGAVYWWWLRSPGARSDLAAHVHGGLSGVNIFGDLIGYETYGVRPAMWILL
ncbi:MAG: DUF6273 domain-containing protein [Oscillospiraceae bacterium]|nr:DUF6273 domain-containing protein [Oscillospiraceae bacterium]